MIDTGLQCHGRWVEKSPTALLMGVPTPGLRAQKALPNEDEHAQLSQRAAESSAPWPKSRARRLAKYTMRSPSLHPAHAHVTHEICNARVPSTRARSYLVI